MIVAAEASSAAYATKLMQYFKHNNKNYNYFGVGTLEMENLGFERIGKAEDMAVVGVSEIIDSYTHLKSIFNSLVAAAKTKKPDVVVLMDYPEFNLMLAKQLHQLGLKVVYYVSPQIWAWRKGRVQLIKKYCQEIYLLFPFEAEFYRKHDVPFVFVGHPALDDLDAKYLDESFILSKRRRMGFSDSDIVLALMPGSRKKELKNHMRLQMDVARDIKKNHFSNLQIVILVAPTLTKEEVQETLGDVGCEYVLIKDDPNEMICIADIVLAASGTATLMVGLLQKPMVVIYKMQWLTYFMAKALVRGVKYFSLVNLIMDRLVIPELWQMNASHENIKSNILKFINDKEYYNKTKSDLALLQDRLGSKGATERVAKALGKFC